MVKLSSSNPEIFRNVGHSNGNLFQINHCLYPDLSRPSAKSLYKGSLKLAKTTIDENEIVETQTECQMYQLGLFTLIRVVIMKLPARVELQYLFRISYL